MKENKTSIGGAEFHALGQDTNKEERELRECVEYCLQQNGMARCKNCGLTNKMITEALSQAKEEGRREEVKIGEKDNQGKDEAWCEWYKCPKCACTMITYKQKYCGECGSSLIWIPTK